ncbi:MAG: transposase zinc-binding domain-containing protein [Pseudomonadales bacterium]|nr:transposase zinc-binding domain-containing protein [Pseudomonadales bacterium]
MPSFLPKPVSATKSYQRHQPDRTTLYQLIHDNYLALDCYFSELGKYLPAYVKREFDAYLKCGKLENGFLRVRCEYCHHERLVAFSCKKRGFWSGRHPVSCGASRMAQTY